MIAPSGPSMMERSPSAGTSLTVMAERLVVALVVVAEKEAGSTFGTTNAEEGSARMAVAITRDLRAGEVIVARAYFYVTSHLLVHAQRTARSSWSAADKVMSSIVLIE